ncbi:aspartate aminotransferase family protein [Catellatospora chokoriensis]|uniref:Adenosylmethionine-8-amino-7-oxononanoate aminotransferase n=1 Tax=Catellatospora chokoriensis TaxID=310353 RepID=A0A8J3JSK0_9ACTN|nr:aminotransferase class III-fold pyridoxal phosphate-dependent enzyme [Catellatospora chokoriensis]GIF90306.1 adenosylmethionine-8-amino-7-oxononanoate aminotransferase [Catellatospora chokoriensis]
MSFDQEEAARLREWDAAYLWHPWTGKTAGDPLMIVRGDGVRVWDADGREYLDAKAASLNASCGYSHPHIVAAITRQAATLMHFSIESAANPPAVGLAAKYASLLPTALSRTFFCNSGSEAMETVVKLARMYHALRGEPGRQTILSLRDGYHGATLGAVTATALTLTRAGNGPLPGAYAQVPTPICPSCRAAEAHDECSAPSAQTLRAAIEEIGPDNIAAFVMEPVLGVAGCLIPDPAYLVAAREVCSEYGILFVLDEVLTGFGRTGRMFGFEHASVVPDVLMTSKGVTGGYAPLAAVTTTQDVYRTFADDSLMGGFRHGHTMSGHALACAASLAVLEVIEGEDLVGNSARVGGLMLDELRRVLAGEPHVFQVRGLGLALAVQMTDAAIADELAAACLELGLIVRTQGSAVCLMPPLTLTETDALTMCSIVAEAARLTAQRNRNVLEVIR